MSEDVSSQSSSNGSHRGAFAPGREVYLVGGRRTPFGKFDGELREEPSVELGARAISATLDATRLDPGDVDELYFGVTIPAEEALDGSIPGRVASLRAGIPADRLSLTIDRACCSSMTATQMATRAIAAGAADVVLAGGADNMGRSPFLVPPDIRWGIKRGSPTLKDPMAEPGADIGGKPVAVDAGEVAAEHGVTREAADAWAARSHERWFAAAEDGFFSEEVVPLEVERGRRKTTVDADESPRRGSTPEVLAGFPTVFGGPIVTAANAPGQNAGACFIALASGEAVERHELEPLARVRSVASIARAPREIAVAPAPALQLALSPLGLTLEDVDLIEINEAFACVPLTAARVLAEGDVGVERELLEKTNVNGGAVAIGHPPGASGARLLLTLARELERRGGWRGAAAICGGLGQGDAAVIEAI
jgi:acetyl-CoA C-acetyltransferase